MHVNLGMLFNRTLLCICTLAGTTGYVSAKEPEQLWQIDQLDQPESVASDPNGKYLYISNINGHPTELNGLGYISRVTVNGQVLDRKWINGLDAPKGMAVYSGKLYVADMQKLHVIDLKTASVVKEYNAPNAKMLNDVTVSEEGTVYVSDLLGGGVYRLQDNQFKHWLNDPKLPHPNGVLWHKGDLLVANWGVGMQADFSTDEPGTLYRVNKLSKKITTQATGYQLGNLDGVVSDKDDLYISDWITGELFRLADNERIRITRLPAGLADIGGSGNGIIYAPIMMDGKVLALKVKP